MKLCWSCYLKQSGRDVPKVNRVSSDDLPDDGWNLIPCDTGVRETCSKCGLTGIYVREVGTITVKSVEKSVEIEDDILCHWCFVEFHTEDRWRDAWLRAPLGLPEYRCTKCGLVVGAHSHPGIFLRSPCTLTPKSQKDLGNV